MRRGRRRVNSVEEDIIKIAERINTPPSFEKLFCNLLVAFLISQSC